jgi:arginine-tRNA-protein transferase
MMSGHELDFWLSRGYFRMQQRLFTCQLLVFDDVFYTVHWLRIDIDNVTYGKDQLRLLRINEKFSVSVKPFVLSDEIESLYSEYRKSINFDAPESVESCLLGGAPYNAFDTYMVEVRDGYRLIAGGIFDNGSRSMAGIMNFYDPAYRKQSLGKFLILQKMKYAQSEHKAYYYPGYLVNNYPKFDYKLFACPTATEMFNSLDDEWVPFSWEGVAIESATVMEANKALISLSAE